MTARSFTEAFAQTAGPLDLDSIESDVRQQAYYDDELLALVVEARELRDSRERAIRWAVTLEGHNAVLLRLARRYYEHVWEFCCASRDELTTDGLTVVCRLDADHDGDHLFIEGDVLGLDALTGSTE